MSDLTTADRQALLDAAPFPALEAEWRQVFRAVEVIVGRRLQGVVDDLQKYADAFTTDDGFTKEEWRMLGQCNCGHCEVGDGICPMRVNAMIADRLGACVEVAQSVSQEVGS